MLEWFSWLVVSFLYNIVYSYWYAMLNNKKMSNIGLKLILLNTFVSIMYIISLKFNIKLISILFKLIWTILFLKCIYGDKSTEVSITSFLIYIISSIGEMIFSIIFIYMLKFDLDFLKYHFVGILFTNLVIVIINLLIFNLKKLKSCITYIINYYTVKIRIDFIFILVLSLFLIYFITYQNSQVIFKNQDYISIIVFFVGIIIFIIGYFKEKTDNHKLTSEYDQLLYYVKTYEDVLEEKSKKQHEYVNQLIVIKELLGNKNKKVKDHINQLLEIEDETEKYNWLNKLKNIPNGGLKGLIYYKIVEMEKRHIKLYIDINDNVNRKNINKYLNDNLRDVSRILGVYIDNAFEASTNSKQKYLIIEASTENGVLEFAISNTYKDKIDFDNIDKEGYSKKGKGRGYGLSLVRDIISSRSDIEQFREMNGIYYVQKVQFQYKK